MKKYEVLDADQKIAFSTIYEALNDCFGTEYGGWMKACWPNTFSKDFRAWFPKLAQEKDGIYISAANKCKNVLSPDWEELSFDDEKNGFTGEYYTGPDLIFAKDAGGQYIFRGVFTTDLDKTTPNHYVSKRIAKKVLLIGDPVYEIKLL